MTDLYDDLSHYIRAEQQLDAPPPAAPAKGYDHGMFKALMDAATRFDARRDSFAVGKGAICRDMAGKLARFGRFASDRQAEFAQKLIAWSQPRQDAKAEQPAFTSRPNTWKAVQGFAHITIGEISFRKKHEEPLWWIKYGDALVGALTAEGAKGFAAKIRAAGLDAAVIKAALDVIEADPIAALSAHGLATGSCGCCGRELTDPESIARGIGPICADRLGGF